MKQETNRLMVFSGMAVRSAVSRPFVVFLASLFGCVSSVVLAVAQEADTSVSAALDPTAQNILRRLSATLDPVIVVQISVGFAIAVILIVVTTLYSRARRAANLAISAQRRTVTDLQLRLDEAETLLEADDQRLVVWSENGAGPQLFGSLPKSAQAPADRARFLSFGNWIRTEDAQNLETAIERLRIEGTAFLETIETLDGSFLEVAGRPSGGRSLVRFRDLTVERSEFAALNSRHENLKGQFETLKSAFEVSQVPVWLRAGDDSLLWVNPAYRRSVDAADDQPLYDIPSSLVETSERAKLAEARDAEGVADAVLPVVVAGERRMFRVVEVKTEAGLAGMALDITEQERAQAALRRTEDFHTSTLDQLATPVAIFGADQRLRSYNNAYQNLWALDTGFLDGQPDDAAILERLRSARKLPEQADFRGWKNDVLDVYRAVEPHEHWWHLPNGQTIRVLANPHPQGGVTYIYENVTEQIDLESRYNALISVQGETLDHLSEAVAVFGPDGKLRLWNPAFSRMWQIENAILDTQPHVSDVVARCGRLFSSAPLWSDFTASVTGLAETRESTRARIERPDDAVIDVATVPLPDGSTLTTFVDISDTVKVERALMEKNIALQAADDLKNAFIQNVSYELRSPLTNIIGFAELLASPTTGQLSEKQAEYTGYIQSSSSALLTIINDILDLATVDAGVMELNLDEVDVTRTIGAVVEALQDRLSEADIRVQVATQQGLGTMVADERRLRQILYNLISNAISYSDDSSSILVHCERTASAIELTVADNGCGIPPDIIESVFERFEGRSSGGRRRGAGLGLSIVKSFVELHNGTVKIASKQGEGTRVVCRFPLRSQAPRQLH